MTDRKKPWLLHSLPVHALNFCSFAMCNERTSEAAGSSPNILIAVPGLQDGQIFITSLPPETRFANIPPPPKETASGMLMAIGLHYDNQSRLHVLAGYESGVTCAWTQSSASPQTWQIIYSHKAHAQPILSLDIAPSLGYFYTSSADAIVARHPLSASGNGEAKVMQTKHAGQQSLTVRSDEKIFATAGWDGRMRVYSTKTMKELAVLKWHKEGCYALAFAGISPVPETAEDGGALVDGMINRDLTVSEQRTAKARETHWLAAGSKDGKISLWDIY
jgi:ASTRA-associated protein 1